MKTLLTIKIHSFCDVITNSSTELFTCGKDITLQFVEETLKKIIEGYNMMNDETCKFEDFFEKPFVFDLLEYRKVKKEDKVDYSNPYGGLGGWFSDDESEEDLEEKRKEYIENGDQSHNWGCDERPYRDRLDKAVEGRVDIERWNARKKEVDKIYSEILESKEKPEWWKEPWKYSYNSSLIKNLDGCVLIFSSDDNSIPYELFDIIERKLNADRRHLG